MRQTSSFLPFLNGAPSVQFYCGIQYRSSSSGRLKVTAYLTCYRFTYFLLVGKKTNNFQINILNVRNYYRRCVCRPAYAFTTGVVHYFYGLCRGGQLGGQYSGRLLIGRDGRASTIKTPHRIVRFAAKCNVDLK